MCIVRLIVSCGLSAWVAAVLADDAADAAALVGSWDLVKLEYHAADGSVSEPFGDLPVGRITYTADGHMSAQIMRTGRTRFASDERQAGTPEEKVAAYDGFIAYYGSYAVDSARQLVTHRVQGSLYPNWVGGDQQRFYRIAGDELTLSTAQFRAQGEEVKARVQWRRAR